MKVARLCPICESSEADARLFLNENIDEKKISKYSFASRKQPEYMCHRLLRCNTCDLVYVSHPPKQSELAEAYHLAEYDSSEEADDAAQAYLVAIYPTLLKIQNKGRVLDIGSGTGVLLDLLKAEGFSELVGVEPSPAAIAAAPAHRRNWLIEGIFEERQFEPESFDLICCFMTMEHVSDPRSIAIAARKLLRPGGAFVTVTHDYGSFVNKFLGKRSPIIDIEHMQLFSKISIFELFTRCNFSDILVSPFKNRYSVAYWIRLAPIPDRLKLGLLKLIKYIGCDKFKLKIGVGNIIASGFKISKQ
jgi:2-polyprenyl-3-methyl-5-hydroxy-6-metoxy-1,4-benzoquinol methylase